MSDTILFSRKELSTILNVHINTIANREKSGIYPIPFRTISNYRYYTLDEVLDLQLITYNKYDLSSIISMLFNKGYTDTKQVAKIIDSAISKKNL